jgi:hypothetical protein
MALLAEMAVLEAVEEALSTALLEMELQDKVIMVAIVLAQTAVVVEQVLQVVLQVAEME